MGPTQAQTQVLPAPSWSCVSPALGSQCPHHAPGSHIPPWLPQQPIVPSPSTVLTAPVTFPTSPPVITTALRGSQQPPLAGALWADFPGSLPGWAAAGRHHSTAWAGGKGLCSRTTQLALSSPPITASAWLALLSCAVNTPNRSRGPEATAEPINLNQPIPRLMTPHTEPLLVSDSVFIARLMDW